MTIPQITNYETLMGHKCRIVVDCGKGRLILVVLGL